MGAGLPSTLEPGELRLGDVGFLPAFDPPGGRLPLEAYLGTPYDPPLDTGRGVMPSFRTVRAAGILRGDCPLCSNARRAELDSLAIRRGPDVVARAYGFPPAVVRRHFNQHLLPLYAFVWGNARAATDFLPGPSPCGAGPRMRGVWKRTEGGPCLSREALAAAIGSGIAAGRGGGYAYDGGERVRNFRRVSGDATVLSSERGLVPWDSAREDAETAKGAQEALNFYDEMLDIRRKCRRVYREVMDGGDLRYYSTAVAAIREMRGVVDTLGKMSLIAKRLGEGADGKASALSPELQAMVDSILPRKDPEAAPPDSAPGERLAGAMAGLSREADELERAVAGRMDVDADGGADGGVDTQMDLFTGPGAP